jgi:hypothetical protein
VEELHTALEQTLRELLPAVQDRARWPELLKMAKKGGLLDAAAQGSWLTMTGHPHTDIELLRSLTKRRNVSKHRTADPSDTWLFEHWDCVAFLLERLVRHLGKTPSN